MGVLTCTATHHSPGCLSARWGWCPFTGFWLLWSWRFFLGSWNPLFLSEPLRYFLPVMHVASCFACTSYDSCMLLWVVPLPSIFKILNTYVVASSLVGLLIFSVFSSFAIGSGIISSLILSCWLSGNLCFLAGTLIRAAAAFTCISGHVLAQSTTISC